MTVGTGPVVTVAPPERVAYQSGENLAAQAVEPALSEGEQLEQVRGDLAGAAALYRQAAASGGPRVQAAALQRGV